MSGFNYSILAATKADALAAIDADVAANTTLPKDGSLQDAARGLMKLVSDGPLNVTLYGHTTDSGEGVIQVVLRRNDSIPVPKTEAAAPAAAPPGTPVTVPH